MATDVLVVDTAKLLLLPRLPSLFTTATTIITNVELVSMEGARKQLAFLQWLEDEMKSTRVIIGALLVPANHTTSASAMNRIAAKLKLLFPRVDTIECLSSPSSSSSSSSHSLQLTPATEFWAPVVGYDHVKRELDKQIRWRFERRDGLSRMGLLSSSSSHCLLHGPSGNGKTLVGSNFSRLGIGFIQLKASDVFSKWYGDSERRIRDAFAKARQQRPCILFLDEVEAIAPNRASLDADGGGGGGGGGVNARVLSTLLNEVDGVDSQNEGVVVIGCTSALHMVDDALVRPGRLGCLVAMHAPHAHDRGLLLRHFMGEGEGGAADHLVQRTAGLSVAELAAMCSRAKYAALRRGAQHVGEEDFAL